MMLWGFLGHGVCDFQPLQGCSRSGSCEQRPGQCTVRLWGKILFCFLYIAQILFPAPKFCFGTGFLRWNLRCLCCRCRPAVNSNKVAPERLPLSAPSDYSSANRWGKHGPSVWRVLAEIVQASMLRIIIIDTFHIIIHEIPHVVEFVSLSQGRREK